MGFHFAYLVVWERVYKQHCTLLKTQSFIGVTGRLKVQSGVTQLVAEELWISETRLTTEETKIRNFHWGVATITPHRDGGQRQEP